jgi:iron(III) transport system substrate-binding protein
LTPAADWGAVPSEPEKAPYRPVVPEAESVTVPRVYSAAWLGCLFLFAAGCGGSRPRVVLYCAQDKVFAEPVLEEFTRRTGIAVAPKFDTEAQKSVGLYAELVQERDRPRGDVHWNNEIIWSIKLQRQGILEPYASPSAAAFPASAKAADDTWHAFAARARILIVNTDLVAEAERPGRVGDLALPRWKGRAAIAKPVHGTSLAHAACLFDVLGPEAARGFYQSLRANEVHVLSGNKQVAEEVGRGRYAVGLTDTDDAILEVEAGRPVVIVFPDQDTSDEEGLGTLFLPNTVAVVRGGPDPENARRLVDYLLSPEVERRLAETGGRQIPLNPQVEAKLPPQIQTPRTAKPMAADFGRAADLYEEAHRFLTAEFGRP